MMEQPKGQVVQDEQDQTVDRSTWENKNQARAYNFSDFSLYPDVRKIAGPAGEISLRPKAFDTLLYLVENRGRVICRDEILANVWTDVNVEPATLTHCILEIRAAFGDETRNPWLIRTVPRVGYQFLGQVSDSDNRKALLSQKPRALTRLFLLSFGTGTAFILGLLWRSPVEEPDQLSSLRMTQLTFGETLSQSPSWSKDGTMIVFSSRQSGSQSLYIQEVERSSAYRIFEGEFDDSEPDWSPESTLIAFRSNRDGGGIFYGSFLGGDVTKVASFGEKPKWSPDGNRILFRDGNAAFLKTLNEEKLTELAPEFLAMFESYESAWHPDGGKVSVLGEHKSEGMGFWTLNLNPESHHKSRVSDEVAGKIRKLGLHLNGHFVWNPEGTKIYFEGVYGGVVDIWAVEVDPVDFTWQVGPTRMTISPVISSDISLSRDGSRMAFLARELGSHLKVFPFDKIKHAIVGPGEQITPSFLLVQRPRISSKGNRLAFSVLLGPTDETQQLWTRNLLTEEKLEVAGRGHFSSCWSPDGRRLAYSRTFQGESQLFVFSLEDHHQSRLTGEIRGYETAEDWSHDGRWLAVSSNRNSRRMRILRLPANGIPVSANQMEVVAEDDSGDLFDPRFSPKGSWMLFRREAGGTSTLWVSPVAGEDQWRRVTAESDRVSSGCWAPDGYHIYYVIQGRNENSADVWVTGFNPMDGTVEEGSSQVTHLRFPGESMLPLGPEWAGFAISEDRIVLTIFQEKGNIWMLEGLE